jgi:hypothetical protein
MTMEIHTIPSDTLLMGIDNRDSGGDYSIVGVSIRVVIPADKVDEALASFDESDPASLPAATQLAISASFMSAVKEWKDRQ